MYKNNQFVFVRGDTTPRDKAVEEPKDFWVARILQVRAKNAQHVYALVSGYLPFLEFQFQLTDYLDCLDVLARRTTRTEKASSGSSQPTWRQTNVPWESRAGSFELYGGSGCAVVRWKGGSRPLAGRRR